MLVFEHSGAYLRETPENWPKAKGNGDSYMINPPTPSPNLGLPPAQPTFIESSGEHKKASPLPVILATVTLLLSIAIQVFQYQLANNIWYYAGYALTPLVITMILGWDSISQRKGRKDPWFETKPMYSKILRVLVLAGFIVAVFHIVAIGIQIGEQVVQSGVTV